MILTARVRQPCPANHSVIQSIRNAGRSSSILVYPYHTVTIFIPEPALVMTIIQQAFVKLKSGQLHGLRNLDHHLPVSMVVYLQLDSFQTDTQSNQSIIYFIEHVSSRSKELIQNTAKILANNVIWQIKKPKPCIAL